MTKNNKKQAEKFLKALERDYSDAIRKLSKT